MSIILTKEDYQKVASLINRATIQVSEAPSVFRLLERISQAVKQLDIPATPDNETK